MKQVGKKKIACQKPAKLQGDKRECNYVVALLELRHVSALHAVSDSSHTRGRSGNFKRNLGSVRTLFTCMCILMCHFHSSRPLTKVQSEP